jgi:predicted nucleic acid-binding protein
MSGVLIDTSVWVDHFRRGQDGVVRLLEQDRALMHPMVLLELACGTPPAPRARTLSDLGLLQNARQASWREVMDFVEREQLYGLGCGLVDLTLLASALITPGACLWSMDKRLAALTLRFGISHAPPIH